MKGEGWRHAAAAAAALLLAACGTAPMREPAPPGPVAKPATPAPTPPAKRGGGYYKDDGPDDNPPPNLELVPDAVPRVEPLHRYANNAYTVFGREYVPDTWLRPYRRKGVASWYGRKFHGQKTSSGEPYDMYGMTAAHPTLPIPSYARVTNLANGRSVVVRVNDRGPFHANRIIDLSYTAAHKLGYITQGSAQVEVESLIADAALIAANPPREGAAAPAVVAAASAPNAPDPIAEIALRNAAPDAAEAPAEPLPTVSAAQGVFLQLAAFTTPENLEAFRAHLEREVPWLAPRLVVHGAPGVHRLQAGPYRNDAEARRAAGRLKSELRLQPVVVRR